MNSVRDQDVAVPLETVPTPPPVKMSKAKVLFFLLASAAVAIATVSYLLHRGQETTDDAQVEGHIINVAARIGGQVTRVLVKDNQLVNEGDALVEIDRRELDSKVGAAKAELAAIKASLQVAQAQLALTKHVVEGGLKAARGAVTQARAVRKSSAAVVEQATAEIRAAQARRSLSSLELERSKILWKTGGISDADMDNRQATFDQADATLENARAHLVAATAGTRNSAGGVEIARGRLLAADTAPEQVDVAEAAVALAEGRVAQAEAALQLAELNASYVEVKAPKRGIVSRRTVEEGQMVSPERALLALVPPDDMWVVANFKEDQVRVIGTGQRARVKVDALGNQDLLGHVESIAGASGARFALLPPDNASGNFIRVVQRIPVLVLLDKLPDTPLRPGMSATVEIETRDHEPINSARLRGN